MCVRMCAYSNVGVIVCVLHLCVVSTVVSVYYVGLKCVHKYTCTHSVCLILCAV